VIALNCPGRGRPGFSRLPASAPGSCLHRQLAGALRMWHRVGGCRHLPGAGSGIICSPAAGDGLRDRHRFEASRLW